MALHGKFVVNNEPLSPLVIFGVGAFQAFSGEGIYRNRGGCTAVAGFGPLPAGRYWIVDRPTGGVRSQVEAWTKDLGNTIIVQAYGWIEVIANGSTCPYARQNVPVRRTFFGVDA